MQSGSPADVKRIKQSGLIHNWSVINLIFAMSDTEDFVNIQIDQLRVGLFVTLDMKWMEHQFLSNSFKIKNEKQLTELKQLGIKNIRYSPSRSDVKPLPRADAVLAAPAIPQPPAPTPEEIRSQTVRKERKVRLEKLRQSVNQCEKKLLVAAGTFKNINQNLYSRPEESVRAATELVDQMAASLLVDKDIAIHAINDKLAGEDVYFHSLNVSVLAMMLAKELEIPKDEIGLVGLSALFHDIGKTRIPGTILNKTEPLTPAEEHFLAEHPRYGEEIGQTLKLPAPIIEVIRHHHEAMDGSGYPDGLNGERLSLPTRLVTIANVFDNLCNHPVQARSLTPHEAVANMFAKQRNLFDPKALGVFIRCMGVYPPGTLVQLKDGTWGMVVSVNPHLPLKPVVLIYDPAVPKEEALLVDLADEGALEILRTFRSTELPRDVFEYLSPRRRITYYFNETAATPSRG